jgi:hypothetical protein
MRWTQASYTHSFTTPQDQRFDVFRDQVHLLEQELDLTKRIIFKEDNLFRLLDSIFQTSLYQSLSEHQLTTWRKLLALHTMAIDHRKHIRICTCALPRKCTQEYFTRLKNILSDDNNSRTQDESSTSSVYQLFG